MRKRIAELGEISMGQAVTGVGHESSGAHRIVTLKHITDLGGLQAQDAYVSTIKNVNARHFLQDGDILVRSRGNSYPSACFVSDGNDNFIAAAPLLIIRCDPQKIVPEYMCAWLNSPKTQAILSNAARGTAVKIVGAEDIKGLEVPVIDRQKQESYAALRRLAMKEQHCMEILTQKRRSLLDGLLQGSIKNSQVSFREA